MTIELGKTYRFAYPTAFVTLPEYTAHRDQPVTVIRQLRHDEADQECQPMFEVKAFDGWIGHADEDELQPL